MTLFVDPIAIGSGCGKALLLDALHRGATAGFDRLVLDADPGAEWFFLDFGATRVGTSPSGFVPGRNLPRLEFALRLERPPASRPQ